MENKGISWRYLLLSVFILILNCNDWCLKAQETDFKVFSILINELMFDPDPQIGLPECEYIELYNTSGDTININGWMLKVGTKMQCLPYCTVPPASYLLLMHQDHIVDFEGFDAHILGLDKWLALRNSGQYLALLDPGGGIIHFTDYHPAQISDNLKKEVGWSLELAAPDHPCGQSSWAVS